MLPLYSNILLPIDFTPNSDHAFKHAVMIARMNNAKIHLLHVMPEIDSTMINYISTFLGESKMAELQQDSAKTVQGEMKKTLDDFAKAELVNFPEDLDRFAETEVSVGHPVVKILEAANKLNVDLIVMGTHGKGVLGHTFLGSVAEKVLNKSTRPVFIVPLPK
ncbi:MAG: universal stress protein [Thermodesulfobacteriota bacterium]|nr:universal stress protein [Thermodesulfobacteriota bacterium]